MASVLTNPDKLIMGLTQRQDYSELLQKFRRSYVVTGSGCWEWTGSMLPKGYGRFYVGHKALRAHRLAFFLAKGRLPNSTDHLCRNRKCVNDEHLEDVDNRTNTLRGTSVPAENSRKQCCKYGHPFSIRNRKHGTSRLCRICERQRMLKARVR